MMQSKPRALKNGLDRSYPKINWRVSNEIHEPSDQSCVPNESYSFSSS